MHLSFFLTVLIILICQRLIELYLANNNAKYMKSLGGFEVDSEHYIYILMLHIGFFWGLVIEVTVFKSTMPSWWKLPMSIFMLVQVLRIWCIKSLGRFWNTRIFILPYAAIIKKGPYKFLRHPNYMVVVTELLVIPLIFGAYYTAVTVSILNAMLLFIRINKEEKALSALTEYGNEMFAVPRFLPAFKKNKEE